MVEVSAKKKQNLDLLLEMILLVTEIERAQGEPEAQRVRARCSKRSSTRAAARWRPILVQDGTLRVGDTFIAGTIVGKVRALIDDRGRQLKSAGPATPVEVLGLGGLPSPGDAFQALDRRGEGAADRHVPPDAGEGEGARRARAAASRSNRCRRRSPKAA